MVPRLKDGEVDPNMIFQCQLCEATFKKRDSLREHNQSVHEGIIYKCLICFVETYKAKKSVKRHLLQIHQIDSPQIDVHYLSEKTDNPTEPGYPTRPLNGSGRIGKSNIQLKILTTRLQYHKRQL